MGALLKQLDDQHEEIVRKTRELAEARYDFNRAVSHYADLYDNAPIAYFVMDSDGLVTDLNLTAATLFSTQRTRMIGFPFLRLVVSSDRLAFLEHMRRCRESGSAQTELRLETGGGRFPVELDTRRTAHQAGDIATYRTAIFDLRQRQRIEEERRRADADRRRAEEREQAMRVANDAKDRFLAELSHELRTPLTPVLALVSSLKQRDDVPSFMRRQLATIERNIEVEARLIDDLLDVSRIGRDGIKIDLLDCDVHVVLGEVAETLRPDFRKHGVSFDLEMNAPQPTVRADAVRLRQIFWNLIVNALHGTPKGGRVVVSTSNVDRDLRVTVRDTGIGIEPSHLERIFAPFVHENTADRERDGLGPGLGLGLAIVKGLVDAHGGRIHAFSDGRNCGAAFVVELAVVEGSPRALAPRAALRPRAVARRDGGRDDAKPRILIVEDHVDSREALQLCLELKGYDVRVAGDVASAIEAAREAVDLLVCDMSLPDGTGLDVVKKISANGSVTAIALTGYGTPQDAERALHAGFAAHLTKPVAAEKLVAAIESLTRRG